MIPSWSFRWEASTRAIASDLQQSSSVQVIMTLLSHSRMRMYSKYASACNESATPMPDGYRYAILLIF